MKSLLRRDGMTLAEVMVASGLSLALLFAIYAGSMVIRSANNDYHANVKLSARARILMEQMVWGAQQSGVATCRGISDAVSATVAASQVDYTDQGGTVHSLRVLNGNIEYRPSSNAAWVTLFDPNGAAAFDSSQYSTSLIFSQTNPSAVQIQLVLGERVKGRWQYASVTTQAAFRN